MVCTLNTHLIKTVARLRNLEEVLRFNKFDIISLAETKWLKQ